jgi:ribosomal protein L7Ae-like RNA K-turn-binding protein
VRNRRPAAPEAALQLLGLAARAGALLPGTERVREAARRGAVHFVIVAADTSENSNDKLLPLLEKRGVPHVVAFTRAELGVAVGHAPLSAVGITQKSLAKSVAKAFESGLGRRGMGSTNETEDEERE